VDIAGLFAGGPLSMSDLIGNINILWHDNSKNVKAYLQSFYMVDYLIHAAADAKTGLARIGELMALVARDVPLERALDQTFRMSYDEFQKGWQKHLRERVKARGR
jgi:hypothetical protein